MVGTSEVEPHDDGVESVLYYDELVGPALEADFPLRIEAVRNGSGQLVQRVPTVSGEIRIVWVVEPDSSHAVIGSIEVGHSPEAIRRGLVRPGSSGLGRFTLLQTLVALLVVFGVVLWMAHAVVVAVVAYVLALGTALAASSSWGPQAWVEPGRLPADRKGALDELLFFLPRAQSLTRSVDPVVAQTARTDVLGEMPRLFLEIAQESAYPVLRRQLDALAAALDSLEARDHEAQRQIEPSTAELEARKKWDDIARRDPQPEWQADEV